MRISKSWAATCAATCAAIVLILSLTGCGGTTGFVPTITAVKEQSLQYGRTATIYLGGKDLRSYLVVDTGGACINPTFASNSTTDVLVLNCTVQKAGDFVLSIKDTDGKQIYSTTLNVPNPQLAFLLDTGSITMELDPAKAPITVDNFLRYARGGFYSSTLFHRVIPGFMIQGGGYTTGMVKKSSPLAPIVLESNNGLSNLRGTVAMARTNVPDSATSEFFINVVDNLFLDYKNPTNPGYAVFGKVVAGMDTVDKIAAQPTGTFNGFNDVPLTDVPISMVLQVK